MTAADRIEHFRDAIRAAGLTPPDVIEPGPIHRFPGSGKRNGNKAGWCKLFEDERGGVFGDFSTGLSEGWQAQRPQAMTAAAREGFRRKVEEAKAKAEAELKAEHDKAALAASERWNAAQPADPKHPYLVAKGVQPYGVKQDGDTLVIPVRAATGELCSLQFIAPNGEKRFLAGGRVAGCYFGIGTPERSVCVAEGFATAASIHEATGHAVAVAFNAGNLEAVARALRAKLPDAHIIVCADDDYGTDGNPGVREATKAAIAVGGFVAIPDFGDDRPEGTTDFNDLARHRGAATVKRAVASAHAPDVSDDQPGEPNAAAGNDIPRVTLVRGDAIKPEPITWLWSGYLAASKLHIVAGAPGTGKTTLALGFAATLTIGGRWPDGSRAPVGDVLIWSGEDSPSDTLAPRLQAAGADMSRVHFVGEVQQRGEPVPFDPAAHFPALALAASRLPNLRLMIVDPIVSAVAGDSHHNAEVRRGLQPLVAFAEQQGCALIGITHFTKGTQGKEPLERVTGSLGFGAVARIVLGTAQMREEDGGGRVLVRVKSNIGPDGGGHKYELRQVELLGDAAGIVASRVEWVGAVEGPAREILAEAEHIEPDDSGGGNAKEFLRDLLATGPMLATTVFRDAEAHGYNKRQMQRARAAISAEIKKQGMRGGWEWSLAKVPTGTEDTEDAAHENVEPSAPSAVSSIVDDLEEVF
jgi:putative DNA primase/helicase